jgi:hypothetical protein
MLSGLRVIHARTADDSILVLLGLRVIHDGIADDSILVLLGLRVIHARTAKGDPGRTCPHCRTRELQVAVIRKHPHGVQRLSTEGERQRTGGVLLQGKYNSDLYGRG